MEFVVKPDRYGKTKVKPIEGEVKVSKPRAFRRVTAPYAKSMEPRKQKW